MGPVIFWQLLTEFFSLSATLTYSLTSESLWPLSVDFFRDTWVTLGHPLHSGVQSVRANNNLVLHAFCATYSPC